MNSRIYARLVLAGTLAMLGPVLAAPGIDSTDPLVGVDRNRAAIIADIVQSFRAELSTAAPIDGVAAGDALRARLAKLRADRLLAASLASSYATLKSILDDSDKVSASVVNSARAKALGDANKDLVYTPLAPCRLIDTRGFGAPIQGGAFTPNQRRAYAPAGGCGLPLSGIATLMMTFTTENLTPGSGGYLAILAPNATVTTSVDIFNLNQEWSASNTAVATGPAGQFDILVAAANAHVVIDILGYFAPPQGTVVSSITAGSGLTGGTITGAGTLGLAATQLLPTVACNTNEIPKWNGAAWACAANTASGGTVTSIATGAGLTGGPITASGTIGLSAAQALPACSTNQFPKWSGTAWICADSPGLASFGGVIAAIPATGGVFVFAGPTTGSVAVISSTKITALATGGMGLTAGGAQVAQVAICSQVLPAGPIVVAAGTTSFTSLQMTPARTSVTASSSFTGLAAGNYKFGLCVQHAGPAAIDNNDFLSGWVMLGN